MTQHDLKKTYSDENKKYSLWYCSYATCIFSHFYENYIGHSKFFYWQFFTNEYCLYYYNNNITFKIIVRLLPHNLLCERMLIIHCVWMCFFFFIFLKLQNIYSTPAQISDRTRVDLGGCCCCCKCKTATKYSSVSCAYIF